MDFKKKCSFCGQILDLNKFYKDKRGIYSSRCKKCYALIVRKCAICGKEFIGNIKRKFCSLECRRKSRPQTFKICQYCGGRFGPVERLNRKFCSWECKILSQKTGVHPKISTKAARAAQSKVAYAIKKGILVRPKKCSRCDSAGKIEAAHKDYSKPLQVRWLCRRCHRTWDNKYPKGGTIN